MFVRFEFHGLFFVSTRHFGWTPRWLLTYLLTYKPRFRGVSDVTFYVARSKVVAETWRSRMEIVTSRLRR